MGAVQSSVNSEALIAGAAVAVGSLTTIVLYARNAKKQQDLQKHADSAPTDAVLPSSASEGAAAEKKSKGKKKKSKEDAEFDRIIAAAREAKAKASAAPVAGVVSFPEVAVTAVPGAFDQSSAADDSEAVAPKEKKAKRKKGKKAASPPAGTGGEPSRSFALSTATSPDSSIIHIPADTPAEPARPPPSRKEKKKRAAKASAADASQQQARLTSAQLSVPTTSSGDAGPSASASTTTDDASWTRVESRKRTGATATDSGAHSKNPSTTEAEIHTSDTNITTSVTNETESEDGPRTEDELEGSSVRQPTSNRKTFAEKMLGKPRKTGVEDMEEEPLQPTLARVIRARPAAGEKPATGFSWGDYEEYAQTGDDGTSADGDEDDTWEEVKSKKRTKPERSASSSGNLPTKSTSSMAPETTTKRQRQNAARRDAAKAEKADAESERAQRLAQHKRELERARIAEQYSSSGSGKNKKVSGGMSALVEDGKLVWE